MEPLLLGLPAMAFSVAGALGLAHLYMTAPRCPECSSLRSTTDAYDSEIRVCRDCHTIYRLHA